MGRINTSASEQSESPLSEGIELIAAGPMMSYPMLLCGVQRKINTGNFENIDVYAAISVPVLAMPADDLEAFKTAVAEAADLGFAIASKQTGDRYSMIKELQKGGRETPPKK